MTDRRPRLSSGPRAEWSPEPVTDLYPDWFCCASVLAGVLGGASVVGAVFLLPVLSPPRRGATHTVRLQTEARRQAIQQARAQSAGARPTDPDRASHPAGGAQ